MSWIDCLMSTMLGFAFGFALFKAGYQYGRGNDPYWWWWWFFAAIPAGLLVIKWWR